MKRAPKVRGYTSPGQRTAPQAGPAAWVVAEVEIRTEGPIHPTQITHILLGVEEKVIRPKGTRRLRGEGTTLRNQVGDGV